MDDMTDGSESAPSAREHVNVDGAINGGGGRGRGMWIREIMYSPVFTRFTRFRDP